MSGSGSTDANENAGGGMAMETLRKENEDLKKQLAQSHTRALKLQAQLDIHRIKTPLSTDQSLGLKSKSFADQPSPHFASNLESSRVTLNKHPASPFEATFLEKAYKAQLDKLFARVQDLEHRNRELEIDKVNLHRQLKDIETKTTRPTKATLDLNRLMRDRDALYKKVCTLEATKKELEAQNVVLTREVSSRNREIQLITHARHTPLPSALASGLSSHTMTTEKVVHVTHHYNLSATMPLPRKAPLPSRHAAAPLSARTTTTSTHTNSRTEQHNTTSSIQQETHEPLQPGNSSEEL
ncbi:hypothetical protein Pelo_9916 [Pelomyxa schiedti]|nr:hypothetical protein Pelo_9916 [Pelomyxa schiedti]